MLWEELGQVLLQVPRRLRLHSKRLGDKLCLWPRWLLGISVQFMFSRFSVADLLWIIVLPLLSSTSSTARGGGGSFKNRKPIEEIGCCESPMAEQKH